MARFRLDDHFTWMLLAGLVLVANGVIQLLVGDRTLGFASLAVGALCIVVALLRPRFQAGARADGGGPAWARPVGWLLLAAALGLGFFAGLPAYHRNGVEPWPLVGAVLLAAVAGGIALLAVDWRRHRASGRRPAAALAGAAVGAIALLLATTTLVGKAAIGFWRAGNPPLLRLEFTIDAAGDGEAHKPATLAALRRYLEAQGEFHPPVETPAGVAVQLASADAYDTENLRRLALAGYVGFHLVQADGEAPPDEIRTGLRRIDDGGGGLTVEAAPVLTGARVSDVWIGGGGLTLTFDDEGRRRLGEVTGANVGRRLAVVSGGRALMAPTIQEAIRGGVVEVSGLDDDEAAALGRALRLGGLPAPLTLLSEETLAR
jgi:hypothetical protein